MNHNAVPSPPQPESIAEFTLKAVVTGVVFGVLFGAANAYLGLRVGLTVSTSIPIAVLSVAVFRLLKVFGRKSTILEANMAQTIGSASSSLATGTIFTIPALFLWGFAPPLWQVAMLALLGGVLGICAMVPLRRLLIVGSDQELPYPEGQACAEVLKATQAGTAGSAPIFIGLAAGALIKLALSAFSLVPSELSGELPFLAKARLALEISPSLFAVGYIIGYRSAAVMVAGSLISAVVLVPLIAYVGHGLTTPLFPEMKNLMAAMSADDIRVRYARYVGAGAVAAGGILTVLRSAPTMYASLRAVVLGLRSGQAGGTGDARDRDMPGSLMIGGIVAVVLILALVPGVLAGDIGFGERVVAALGVAVFGVLFVAVSSRIVGLIGVSSNPTSGMTLITLLGVSGVFVLAGKSGPEARALVLTVGTVVCIAASKAGDISQDLKTGFLVGATPAKQQFGQLIAACVACWAVAGTVLALAKSPGFGEGGLAAPQATLMRTVIEGVLSGSLPWDLVTTGAALGLTAALAGLPALAFAVGLYLPLATMTPVFLGGLVRRFTDARKGNAAAGSDAGVLCASGLIAGDGLAGVALAIQAAITAKKPGGTLVFPGIAGEAGAVALALFCLALIYVFARGRSGQAS